MSRHINFAAFIAGLIAFSGASTAKTLPAHAMGKGHCAPLSGTYVLEHCNEGEHLRLMAADHIVQGFVKDLDWLAVGEPITLTQPSCESLSLDYRGVEAVEHATLSVGKTLLSGQKGIGSSRTTRAVKRTHRGIAVEDDHRFVYVPVLAVFHTFMNWKFERQDDESLIISFQGEEDDDRNICRLVPMQD